MPRRTYKLDLNEELEISWSGAFTEITVSLNKKQLVAFERRDRLLDGYQIDLPRGRDLQVGLVTRPWGYELYVKLDGVALSDEASDPKYRLRVIFMIIVAVGSINLLMGGLAALFNVAVIKSMGFGQHSMFIGATLIFLGFMVQGESRVGLFLVVMLYLFDGAVSIYATARSGNLLPYGGMFFRVVIVVMLWPGFNAMRQLLSAEREK